MGGMVLWFLPLTTKGLYSMSRKVLIQKYWCFKNNCPCGGGTIDKPKYKKYDYRKELLRQLKNSKEIEFKLPLIDKTDKLIKY